MKLTRVQQLAAGLGFILFIAFFAHFIYLKDKRTSTASLIAANKKLEQDIRVAEAIQQNVNELREEMGHLTAQLDRLKEVLPTEVNKPKFMADIKRYANESGLEIFTVSQNRPVQDTEIVEHPFTIVAKGGYHDFGTFFATLTDYPRIINVKGLTLNRLTDSVYQVEASFLVSIFTYREPTQEEIAAQLQAEREARDPNNRRRRR